MSLSPYTANFIPFADDTRTKNNDLGSLKINLTTELAMISRCRSDNKFHLIIVGKPKCMLFQNTQCPTIMWTLFCKVIKYKMLIIFNVCVSGLQKRTLAKNTNEKCKKIYQNISNN